MSLFLVAFTLPTFATCISKSHSEDGPKIKISITLELGRKSKGCRGIGLCNISANVSIENRSSNVNPPPRENTATGMAWIEDDGTLTIEFNLGSMTYSTYQSFFGTGEFSLVENFVLSADVSSKLGIKGYTIKAGQYDVPALRSESNTFTLAF